MGQQYYHTHPSCVPFIARTPTLGDDDRVHEYARVQLLDPVSERVHALGMGRVAESVPDDEGARVGSSSSSCSCSGGRSEWDLDGVGYRKPCQGEKS